MRHCKIAARIWLVGLTACLLSLNVAEAQKPDKPPRGGGNGGETTATHTLVDLLGFLVGGAQEEPFIQSEAASVNEPDGAGGVQVVGEAYTQKDRALDPAILISPILWEVSQDGTFTTVNLGLPEGAWEARATDVNDWGVITISERQSDDLINPAWVSYPGLSFQLLPFNGNDVTPWGINNFNEIAGGPHRNNTPGYSGGANWQLDALGEVPVNPIDLGGFLPTDISDFDSQGIADSGVMAGWNQNTKPSIAYFVDGVLVVEPLDPSRGAPGGIANAISPNGQWVAGYLGSSGGGSREAFVWSAATGMIGLGTLGGTISESLGVNDSGQVVGFSHTSDGRNPVQAFFWENGQMSDLGDLAGTSKKIVFQEATAISNSGHIVGSMLVKKGKGEGELHAFVLIPNNP